MPRTSATPLTHERTFGIEELFFSTTDRKGIIVSGNRVFTRVSGWTADELVGEPHSILRHPDMPRVVFNLLWDEIQAGRPIVAYVKNLAKDGGYYWVVATVVPVADGYLSVRFKPSSAFFPVVQGLYAKLRAIEATVESEGHGKKAAMAASAAALGEALAGLGFATYHEFMRVFVPAELKSRDEQMTQSAASGGAGRSGPPAGAAHHAVDLDALFGHTDALCGFLQGQFQFFADFIALSETLTRKSQYVVELAQRIRLISQNVSISASRLDANGRPLAVVATTIQNLADSSSKVVVGLTSGIGGLSASLRDLAFRVAVARLQAQAARAFVDEVAGTFDPGSHDKVGKTCESISALSHCLNGGLQQVFTLYSTLESDLRQTMRESRRLSDFLETLHMIRLAGKIEVSRLSDQGEFGVLFNQVESQLTTARAEMEEFDAALHAIQATTHRSADERRSVLDRLKQIEEAAVHLGAVEA